MKKKVYGEISIEAYQKALEASKRKKDRLAGICENGSEESKKSPSPPPVRPTKRRRIPRFAQGLVVALLVMSTYAAGATWQWNGLWARSLTMDHAIQIVDDERYSSDEFDRAMGKIRTEILLGLQALRRATEREGGEWAATYIESTLEQSQELLAEIRDH